MNAILENNRAYQFAQLESALRSGDDDRAQEILARLRQLGVDVRLAPELQALVAQSRLSDESQEASKQ